MNIGVYQGASALESLERWQNLISQNIASSSIPGYKKTDMSFEGVAFGQLQSGRGAAAQSAIMPVDDTKVSFETGYMSQTGNPTDFAIEGDGFFEVKDSVGNSLYTRDGEFHINTQNQLTTKNGSLVQGVGGAISLIPGGGDIAVDNGGQIYQGTQLVGRLKVVAFDDNSKLEKVNGGFLSGSASPKSAANSKIAQGYLEGSNVSAVDEMVNLIRVSRAQEANQKTITAYDERLGRVIQTFTR